LVTSIDAAASGSQISHPVLYSFRRCPYAMRARLALAVSGQRCELREVVLRNKPSELIAASPKGTVPVLVESERVIDESLQIMQWALRRSDPERWLLPSQGSPDAMELLIELIDTEFKAHLDCYKYPSRHGFDAGDSERHRTAAAVILEDLNARLATERYLFGDRPVLADFAIAPFIRQFAQVDFTWFSGQRWPGLQAWLRSIVDSALFTSIMNKYPPWIPGTTGEMFP
jgi:glutathione S-transferase